jgi:hypothetical protein
MRTGNDTLMTFIDLPEAMFQPTSLIASQTTCHQKTHDADDNGDDDCNDLSLVVNHPLIAEEISSGIANTSGGADPQALPLEGGPQFPVLMLLLQPFGVSTGASSRRNLILLHLSTVTFK